MSTKIETLLTEILNLDDLQPPPWHPHQHTVYAYIEAELNGENASARFPHLKQLLNQYPDFKADYEEAKTLLTLIYNKQLQQPPLKATIDLSFLTPPPSIWKQIQTTTQNIQRLFTPLQITITQKRAYFKSLPNPLVAQPLALGTTRTTLPTKPELQILPLPTPDHNFSFGLKIGQVENNKITFGVHIQPAASPHPQPKTRVTLRDKDLQMLESVLIKGNKEATFKDMPPDIYWIEVTHKKQTYQLQVEFSSL